MVCRFDRRAVSISAKSHGGAGRDRTDDLKLAKLPLSQLSYGPFWYLRGASTPCLGMRAVLSAVSGRMVGLGRLELPTSRLSSARSNQLSYKPDKFPRPKPRHLSSYCSSSAGGHLRGLGFRFAYAPRGLNGPVTIPASPSSQPEEQHIRKGYVGGVHEPDTGGCLAWALEVGVSVLRPIACNGKSQRGSERPLPGYP